MQIRLDKFVSTANNIARKEANKLINKGCVTVNDIVIKKSDTKILLTDTVKLNGIIINYEEFVYIMLNKPVGVVSASKDGKDITVVDLVKNEFSKRELFPAGRLDKTSTGLVLLTDDGKFAHDILSPKHHVPKTYIVEVDKPITQEVVDAFNAGVTLADGTKLKQAEIYNIANNTKIKIVLHQGVYHQIKRMLGVYDIGVNTLHRVSIGGLELPPELASGQFIKLSNAQVSKILKVN